MEECGANWCGLKSKFSITLNTKIVLYLGNKLFESAGKLPGRQEAPDPQGLRFRRVRHTAGGGAVHCPGL